MEGTDTSSSSELKTNTLQAENTLEFSDVYIPKDIIFPDELNRYLRDQIQYLNRENSALKNRLQEKCAQLQSAEAALEQTRKKSDDNSDANKNGFATAANVASAKIVELSKKLREKNAEIEVLKTKVAKLEKSLMQEINQKQENIIQTVPEKQSKPDSELEEQIKVLQEKLSSTSQKLFDARNSNMQLKSDVKLANKLLQQEIGESFENVQNLTNSNWRGRAQIICDLQQKVRELREKLKAAHEKGTEMSLQEKRSVQSRFQKRAQVLASENENLKQEIEEVKRKLEGSKARCKILETEYNNAKAKMAALTDQSERDHEMITSLMGQLTNTKDLQGDLVKQKNQIIHRLEDENRKLKLELTKEQCRSENLKEIIEKQKEGKEYESNEMGSSNDQTIIKEQQRTISKLTVEKDKLLELVEHNKKRLEKERDSHANIQKQYNAERQRAAKLEAKLARAQLEYTERSTYSNVSNKNSLAALEDQLELAQENIKALKTRLELEKEERQIDLQEFANILRATTCKKTERNDEVFE